MISLRPKHLRRYRDIAWVLMKHGQTELVKQSGLAAALAEHDEPPSLSTRMHADEFARDLERLGPTYVKLGQLLSTRPDILPPAYLQSLARLQDHVEPVPYEAVREIVESELGVAVEDVFTRFDRQPLASASLGQVHRGTLRNGKAVAVKVQRPCIREAVIDDLDALHDLAGFLDAHTEIGRKFEFARLLDLLRTVLLQELDYRSEADNSQTIADNLEKFENILVPRPVLECTTSRILTMDFIVGNKVTALSDATAAELDRRKLADDLFRAYLQQVLVDGIFHADPHPGNICLTVDAKIALLDLGMICRVPPRMQEELIKLLLTIADGRGEEAAEVTAKIGMERDFFDAHEFRHRITQLVTNHRGSSLGRVQLGRIVLEIQRAAGECGMRMPDQITMLGKTMMNLDKVIASLDPDLTIADTLKSHTSEIMRRRSRNQITMGRLYHSLMETNELVTLFPERLNKILQLLAENKLTVDVNAVDEDELIRGIQKVANRITVGLILAALIVGASLIMDIETDWTLFGYPLLAMLFFLSAACGGLFLVFQVLFSDRRRH